MKLDLYAKEAAREAKQAGRTMPIVPIEKLRRRRLYLIAPLATAGVAAALAIIVFVLPTADPSQPANPEPTATTLETAPTTTIPAATTTPQVVSPPDTDWVRGTSEQIFDAKGEVLFEFPSTILYGRNTAWDGNDGFVALTEAGLIWMGPDRQETIDAPFGSIIDVAITETGTHVVGINGAEDVTIHWFELESGEEVEQPSTARTIDAKTFTFGDRTATIVDPDWSDVEFDETGMYPTPPFDLPELVVTDAGDEVLRMTVGSEDRPFAEVHDFDGRRLVVAALPIEPAVPPTTVWIIDLECADCTQRFDTPSLEYFDLIGVLPSEGEVVEPALP